MGFGKRDGGRQAPRERRTLGADSTRPVRSVKSVRPRRDNGNLSGLTIAAVGLALCVGGFAVFGPPVSAMNSIFSGKPAVDDSPKLPGERAQNSPVLNNVYRACLPEIENSNSKSPKELFWQRVDLLSGNENGHPDADVEMVFPRTKAFGAYVTCAMKTRRDRLCQPEYRAGLAAELKYYFAALHSDFVRRIELHQEQAYEEDFMSKINRLQRTGGDRPVRKLKIEEGQTTNPPDPRVVENMRALIADGYLTKNDFGWGMPSSIKAQFDGIVFGLDRCNDL